MCVAVSVAKADATVTAPEATNPTYDGKAQALVTSASAEGGQLLYSLDGQAWSKADGQMSGTIGKAKRLEAIRIRLANKPFSGSIQYRTHVQSYGWEKGWRLDGAMSGTNGKGKRLEAIQIKLTGEMAKRYDVYYRVHAQTYGWLGWAKNGASAGTAKRSKRLEAIQIVLVLKGGKAPGTTAGAFRQG